MKKTMTDLNMPTVDEPYQQKRPKEPSLTVLELPGITLYLTPSLQMRMSGTPRQVFPPPKEPRHWLAQMLICFGVVLVRTGFSLRKWRPRQVCQQLLAPQTPQE